MKKLLLLLVLISGCAILFSQTVENIRVEPEGEEIKINYRIGGSIEGHVYNVTLTCSIDKGPRFEPRTVIGDVGRNIRGGKSYYTIVWDVFNDVDEIGEVEFFIKVELVDGKQEDDVISNIGSGKPSDGRKVFISYEISFLKPIGIRAGTLGKWGFYGRFAMGTYDYFWESYPGAITVGATRRIANKPNYRLHGYTGLGVGDYFDFFNFEFGINNVFWDRLNVNFGFEVPTYYSNVTFGIGVVF